METTAAFDGLACRECGSAFDATVAGRCPDCGGRLVAEYDRPSLDRDAVADRRFDGIGRYADLLPFPAEAMPTMDEGTTPLVECPRFADELGVDAVYVKDEGANPTGTTADRQFAVAVAAARGSGGTDVALPTTGDGGQSAAAYAARAGLTAHAFVPMRSTFVAKAMTNVHGGDMTVVQGRYPEAVAAFEDAMADRDDAGEGDGNWYSLAPFDTPHRQEGAKTVLFEVVEQLDWSVPDAVVHPTGHGIGVAGGHLAARQLRDAGLVAEVPPLYVAQADGCAPVVAAVDAGADAVEARDRPDTIVGRLEVPDPAGGRLALDAVRETDGEAVAVSDESALESATRLAREGVEVSATGGVGAAGARELAAGGQLGRDDTVVIVNPVAGNKENDVLRSHLMRKGI